MLYQGESVLFVKDSQYCVGVCITQDAVPPTRLSIAVGNDTFTLAPDKVRICNVIFSTPEPVPTLQKNPFRKLPWFKRIFKIN